MQPGNIDIAENFIIHRREQQKKFSKAYRAKMSSSLKRPREQDDEESFKIPMTELLVESMTSFSGKKNIYVFFFLFCY